MHNVPNGGSVGFSGAKTNFCATEFALVASPVLCMWIECQSIQQLTIWYGVAFAPQTVSAVSGCLHSKNLFHGVVCSVFFRITQDIFWRLHKRGYITENTLDQLYCGNCNRFICVHIHMFVLHVCVLCVYVAGHKRHQLQRATKFTLVDVVLRASSLTASSPAHCVLYRCPHTTCLCVCTLIVTWCVLSTHN